jgi:hypothetical protein
MTSPDLTGLANRALVVLSALASALEDDIQDLETEQEDSQEAADEWDEESGEPEPDVVDHSAQIDVLETALAETKAAQDAIEGLSFTAEKSE